MSKERVNTFDGWIVSTDRRIDRLERLPRRWTSTGGGGGGTGTAHALSAVAMFFGGVAQIPVPASVPAGSPVVGTFTYAANAEIGMSASTIGSKVHMRSAVSDGAYPVTLIFVVP